MNLQFIKAGEDDAETIHQLACSVWRDYYPGIITTGQIEYMLEKMHSIDIIRKQIAHGQQFYLIINSEIPVGYFSFSGSNDNYYLHKIYILTSMVSKGIGSAAISKVLSLIPESAILKLNVNRRNFKAINFYFKNGFTIEGIEDIAIGNGYLMEDFVMKKLNRKTLS